MLASLSDRLCFMPALGAGHLMLTDLRGPLMQMFMLSKCFCHSSVAERAAASSALFKVQGPCLSESKTLVAGTQSGDLSWEGTRLIADSSDKSWRARAQNAG